MTQISRCTATATILSRNQKDMSLTDLLLNAPRQHARRSRWTILGITLPMANAAGKIPATCHRNFGEAVVYRFRLEAGAAAVEKITPLFLIKLMI